MRRHTLLAALVAVGLVAVVIGLVEFAQGNRLIVRNESGAVVRCLRVLVQQAGESAAVDEVVARMEPGAERVWRHGCHGCSVTVSAAYGGRTIEYHEAYVDLWSGDEWVAMIKPDGSLAGGHAGVGPRADGTLPNKAVLLTRFARGRPPGRSASLMDDDGRQSN